MITKFITILPLGSGMSFYTFVSVHQIDVAIFYKITVNFYLLLGPKETSGDPHSIRRSHPLGTMNVNRPTNFQVDRIF